MTTDLMITDVRLSPDEARALTDRIKADVEVVWDLIVKAYSQGAWSALGYHSWDDYVVREFGTSRLRVPREERAEVVAALRESGMSIRAIAAATGDSVGTVHMALRSGVQDRTPGPDPIDEDVLSEDLIEGESDGVRVEEKPPGAPTDSTPGQTDRVREALARAREPAAVEADPAPVMGRDRKRYQPTRSRPHPNPEGRRRKSITSEVRSLRRDLSRIIEPIKVITSDDHLTHVRDAVVREVGPVSGDAVTALQELDAAITGQSATDAARCIASGLEQSARLTAQIDPGENDTQAIGQYIAAIRDATEQIRQSVEMWDATPIPQWGHPITSNDHGDHGVVAS
nr:hypothetical protein [Mycolicibacterium komanii]